MSWPKNLFVSKNKTFFMKAENVWQEICWALERLGEEVIYTKEKGRTNANTPSGPGKIRIHANWGIKGAVCVTVPRLEHGDNTGGLIDAFLGGRRSFVVLFSDDMEQAKPEEIAQEFHDLSLEFSRSADRFYEIQRAANEEKAKIDKSAEEKKAKIDKDAREQIEQL